jgi:signal transduction histidine kinase/CheY-like chemotaxis protein
MTIAAACKTGYKREKLTAFLVCPLYLTGLYFFLLRFTDPFSRLGGCFVQTAALVCFYVFLRRFNIRIVSEAQVAELVFSRVEIAYLFADQQGNIFYANNSALDFFDMGLEEIQNKYIENLFVFEDEPLNLCRYREQDKKYECRAVAVNSGALCHISLFYKWDIWDELICVVIRVEDITEREQLIRQLEQARLRAEDAAQAKNIFLANTSHEIRTPMNAILGMVELILRQEISQVVFEHAMSIKQAGTNLLTIINDVLDFSKIESGKLDIVPSEYKFSSLINDCVSIIRMRIAEKPLLFIVNVEAKLPDNLIGDVVRVRQVMINILANAVKYTKEGTIVLSVTGGIPPSSGELQDAGKHNGFSANLIEDGYDQVILKVEVRDTGVGIKEEDIDKIFEEFQQLDSHREHSVEGTGLGLAISRNLCRQMGGDITVQSEYGVGSVFTAFIPQVVLENKPIAQVHDPETKPVLLYERRSIYEDSLIASFKNLDVPVKAVPNPDMFFLELEGERYAYAFVSAPFADETIRNLRILENPAVPVILSEGGEISVSREAPVLSMPAYVISIANVLNGKQQQDSPEKTTVRFIAPDARILIVDDIQTNLSVAQGLLSLYRMDIYTAISGDRAIEMVSRRNYDLILMDHMMPGMDGIEAVRAIRALDKSYARSIPIVALTANAVSGMKEMFLENGFNDFLPKPIEIPKLDEIVTRWIPAEKKKFPGEREKRGEAPAAQNSTAPGIPPVIEGVDTRRGIAMTGGSERGYRDVLSVLGADIRSRMPDFKKLAGMPENIPLTLKEFSAFTIQVHAMKSALASIGAFDLSKAAAALETAGRDVDRPFIAKELPAFIRDLQALAEKIEAVVRPEKAPREAGSGDITPLFPILKELRQALLSYDISRINRLTKRLEAEDSPIRDKVDRISEFVLLGDYEDAAELIEGLLSKNRETG